MARIVVGSYMVRYPLGGMMSWVLQYLVGFKRLGHEVYFVEKAGYPNSCFDPERQRMSDDCSYGTRVVDRLLSRFGLDDRWCYVDAEDRYHGLEREAIEAVFDTAAVFVDMGTHGSWLEEAGKTDVKVWIDGEPGFTQMKLERRLASGESIPDYDAWYTTGQDVGTERSDAPTAGIEWRPIFHPVVPDLFETAPPPPGAPFTTVMNWRSYEPLEYRGRVYGHKDVEFARFVDLPSRTGAALEVAVAGDEVPRNDLCEAGWHVRDGHEVTISFDAFVHYLRSSSGEFGVCKNGFVELRTGWFSDRSAAYLASGRPVVLQETGFSDHLPVGKGLFAVRDVDQAAEAIRSISDDFEHHAAAARRIATECLDARVVLGRFLSEVGVR